MWTFTQKQVTDFTVGKNYYTGDNVRLKITVAIVKLNARSFWNNYWVRVYLVCNIL